jgi:hypothetical protein
MLIRGDRQRAPAKDQRRRAEQETEQQDSLTEPGRNR